GDGKTTLRGGYGIFYNQTTLLQVRNMIYGNPAYVQKPIMTSMPISFDAPNLTDAIGGANGQVQKWTLPYTQSWSLDIQRQFGKSMVDIAYVGNNTQHLQGEEDLNQPLPGAFVDAGISPIPTTSAANPNGGIGSAQTAYLNLIRPYKGWSALEYISNRYFADYNGLQVQLRQSLGKSSKMVVNYTWSKAMSNSGDANEQTDPQNRFDLKSEWGPTPKMDRRHVLTGQFIYNFPFFRKQRGLTGKVLGGWEMSGIFQVVSGFQDTVVVSNVDAAGQGIMVSNAKGRPDMISNPNKNAPHQTIGTWFNTDAFASVPPGAFRPGNEKPGSVRLPGYQIYNISVFKNFQRGDRQRLQIRAESFNLPNHPNPQGVTMGFGNANYGKVSSWQSMRQIQFGAKYYF
ncbi:MAG: hypothetical protein FWD64_00890, partial [Acidobacteriaceae bacterium]|nr:hypothetical protein [Acidobacteriaceae bacterium]